MVSDIFFLIVFAAIGCFLASRAYLLLVKRQLNVKERVYSRSETPGAKKAAMRALPSRRPS